MKAPPSPWTSSGRRATILRRNRGQVFMVEFRKEECASRSYVRRLIRMLSGGKILDLGHLLPIRHPLILSNLISPKNQDSFGEYFHCMTFDNFMKKYVFCSHIVMTTNFIDDFCCQEDGLQGRSWHCQGPKTGLPSFGATSGGILSLAPL